MTALERGVPPRVGVLLGLDERALAHLRGVHESGVLLTHRQLLAWRVNGISPGMQLSDVERLVYDRGPRDVLVVVPRAAAHGPLVLLVDPVDRPAGEALLAAIRAAVVDRARARDGVVTTEAGEFLGISTIRFRREG